MTEDPYDELGLPPDLVAQLKAGRDERQARMAKLKEELAQIFKIRDSVIFSYLTPPRKP